MQRSVCYAAAVRAAAVLIAFAVLVPAFASAQAGPTRDRVREMLSGIEHTPSDADWRRIGDSVIPVLMGLYNDTSQPPYVRLRAMGATGAFPRAAVRTFLLAVTRIDGQSDLFIREAVVTLARGFGSAAVADLVPFLAHDEDVVREATAQSLGRVGGGAAMRALRVRLRVERDGTVRRAIERALL
ncbi:HEAT repeat domain-containing protein [bacterium AH-315-N03]|nr:HEAT repeat domain-containing protein [bacterium AH-315-N03]MBN4049445.1 HEAT repeat domain-containing protein [bacterium AH-315-N03]